MKARSQAVSKRAALWLSDSGATPNAISVAGLVFAAMAGGLLALSPALGGAWQGAAFALSAFFIAARLAANMLDGLVAVEGGKAAPDGPLYNEMPDRFADIAVLAGAGYAAILLPFGVALGWGAACLAVLVAYVRALGESLDLPGDFSGPMAKPARMWVIAAAALASAFQGLWGGQGELLWAALIVVGAGALFTALRRILRLRRALLGRS